MRDKILFGPHNIKNMTSKTKSGGIRHEITRIERKVKK